ncbi:peptide chain release factor N(5)-glutamine methyltransferase [Candidatus Peregrinibacteria bacterium CG10_big_fil_rev_8_21_14_0_10_55_24]|nr:MAG: peptide chain release factor N(5)-glutamine methyltransferase [Candidatus Peregrinibacteria bacterium CG10_big_fil_rev_8_21_14_0_10_55_24]
MQLGQKCSASPVHPLDRELLAAAALMRPRSWIVAHPEYQLTSEEELLLSAMLTRRAQGEPLAYITGTKEFYGRPFAVDRRVLIPRPSTEVLVELALECLQAPLSSKRCADTGVVAVSRMFGDARNVHTVVDVGTGSGCVAITLACERPNLHVLATDTSADALNVARENALRLGISDRIQFIECAELSSIPRETGPFLVVSNPPYIPQREPAEDSVHRYEPHQALYAGPDGTQVLKRIMEQARAHPGCRGVVLECREEQARRV